VSQGPSEILPLVGHVVGKGTSREERNKNKGGKVCLGFITN
jgi:hypothetical protein